MAMSLPLNWFQRLFRRRDLDCKDIQDFSSDYIDDGLSPTLGDRFRHHLDGCEKCNTFVSTLRATILTLRDLPRRPVPTDLKDRVRQRLQQESEAPTQDP